MLGEINVCCFEAARLGGCLLHANRKLTQVASALFKNKRLKGTPERRGRRKSMSSLNKFTLYVIILIAQILRQWHRGWNQSDALSQERLLHLQWATADEKYSHFFPFFFLIKVLRFHLSFVTTDSL